LPAGAGTPGGPPAPANFLEILKGLWWKLDRALTEGDLYPSAVIPLCESLRKGVTTVFDHHASPECAPGSLDAIAEACRDVGVRASLSYEVSDRDGSDFAAEGIEENRRFLQRCADDRDPLLAGLFGLHAQFTLGDETLAKCSDVGRGFRAGFHVHVAEDELDETDAVERTGSESIRAVHRLNRFKLLGPKTIAAHCVHVSPQEVSLLASSSTFVATNPQSNQNNAVGATPLFSLLDAGVPVALGSDGMTGDLFQEAKALSLIHRHIDGDPRRGWTESEQVAVVGAQELGARHFKAPVGVIKPGAYADLVLRDYASPTPLIRDNVWGHFLFGLGVAPVTDVWVGGEQVVADGRVTGVHEESVARDASERSKALWERLQ
jgi:putative selenium metabolism protein SsnA